MGSVGPDLVCGGHRHDSCAPAPTLSVADASDAENDGKVEFTVTLSEAAATAVTATWTASIETDDTAVAADLGTTKTGTVTVAAGNMMGTFEVPVVNDATDEGDETFTVTLSSPSSNAKLETDPTATGTIEDDDAAMPTISAVAVTSTPVLETDTYGAGETIEVSVTFNEAVTATSDTDFVLSVAGASRAPLVRGSGTATLVFGYTVVSSDEDDDGIWIGDQDRTLVGNRNGIPRTARSRAWPRARRRTSPMPNSASSRTTRWTAHGRSSRWR